MDTAREVMVGYVNGDASVVVGSTMNCRTDAERRCGPRSDFGHLGHYKN